MENSKKIAMTIAGSDPSSGAGIQADLKAFTILGVHGITVVTCITAQNTKQVKKTYKLPIEIIEKQIDVILEDFHPNAVKTGMLYDIEIVKCVTKKIKKHNMKPVVDPVMVATSGDSLYDQSFINALKKDLIPISYILTPNINEAEKLTKMKIKNIEDVKQACKELHKIGAKYILIKGGHLTSKEVNDVFFDGKKFQIFSLPRIKNRQAHGSGCTLSALITGFIALGEKPNLAVRKSKHMLWNMINTGYKPGKGADVLNYHTNITVDMPPIFSTDKHFEIWLDVKAAVERLISFLKVDSIPEVGINIGYALPNAKKPDDICAIDGRIIKRKEKPLRCGNINFGVSNHIASIILATISIDPEYRCAMNIRYSEENIIKFKEAGLKIGTFDRKHEPEKVKSTMEWGTKQAIKTLGSVPDIIYDKGGIGKEPMIRILGKNPKDVVYKTYILFKNP